VIVGLESVESFSDPLILPGEIAIFIGLLQAIRNDLGCYCGISTKKETRAKAQ
jgi:hypothetical protein